MIFGAIASESQPDYVSDFENMVSVGFNVSFLPRREFSQLVQPSERRFEILHGLSLIKFLQGY